MSLRMCAIIILLANRVCCSELVSGHIKGLNTFCYMVRVGRNHAAQIRERDKKKTVFVTQLADDLENYSLLKCDFIIWFIVLKNSIV